MQSELSHPRMHPVVLLLITLLVVAAGVLLVGQFIGLFLGSFIYSVPFEEIAKQLKSPQDYPTLRPIMLIMMGCGHFIGMIIFPLFILKRRNFIVAEITRRPIYLTALAILVLILFSFLIVDAPIATWNETVHFPEWMASFERWARGVEDGAKVTTEFITKFDSFGSMLAGLLVIAILPAIGEELVFRGLIQKDLHRGTGNIHVAIWLSAILFSAFHVQFFGFVPRMLLGALFGYLYYWSGSLVMPMIAHFLNNSFVIVSLYLYQQKYVTVDMENPEAPPWPAIIGAGVVFAGVCYLFKKFYDQRPLSSTPDQQNFPHSLD